MGHNNNYYYYINLLMIIPILLTFFPTTFSAIDGDYRLGSTCINMTNKLSNKFFHVNLVNVFYQLNKNASSRQNKNRGFYYLSRGGGEDTAYGLAQCRQDIPRRDCHYCLHQAYKDLLTLCPIERTAIIWYNHCMIKYADSSLLGNPDHTSTWVYYFVNGSPMGGPDFPATAYQLMVQLQRNVVGLGKDLFYSTTAHVGYLYGMSQCNRDIDQADCYTCIKSAADYLNSQIVTSHYTYVGQRVVYVSCSIRFDNFAFY